DVDKGRFHARKHVLHPADVHVAVDLVGVVGGPRDVVLDEGASFEHRNLGDALPHLHAHQVAPDGFAAACAPDAHVLHVDGVAVVAPLAIASSRATTTRPLPGR